MQSILNLEQIAETTFANATYGLFINGEWRAADSGSTFAVTNPATGETLATVPEGGADDTRAAIDAASAALPKWSALPAQIRGDLLRKVAALMLERREHLATVMTLEQGKPLSESRGEITYAGARLIAFQTDHGAAPTRRRSSDHHALEFSGSHADAQTWPGLGGRLYRSLQTR